MEDGTNTPAHGPYREETTMPINPPPPALASPVDAMHKLGELAVAFATVRACRPGLTSRALPIAQRAVETAARALRDGGMNANQARTIDEAVAALNRIAEGQG